MSKYLMQVPVSIHSFQSITPEMEFSFFAGEPVKIHAGFRLAPESRGLGENITPENEKP
jgi:hypothetical protein